MLVATGIGIGLLVAYWAGKALDSMLFGVGSHDPLVMGAACLCLFVVALIAAAAPALRASRIDPVIAIRAD